MDSKEFYNALARDDLARNGWEILGDTFRQTMVDIYDFLTRHSRGF